MWQTGYYKPAEHSLVELMFFRSRSTGLCLNSALNPLPQRGGGWVHDTAGPGERVPPHRWTGHLCCSTYFSFPLLNRSETIIFHHFYAYLVTPHLFNLLSWSMFHRPDSTASDKDKVCELLYYGSTPHHVADEGVMALAISLLTLQRLYFSAVLHSNDIKPARWERVNDKRIRLTSAVQWMYRKTIPAGARRCYAGTMFIPFFYLSISKNVKYSSQKLKSSKPFETPWN